MKKSLSCIVLLLTLSEGFSQGVSKMYGLVGGYPQANQGSNGFLFNTDSTGQNLQVSYNFPVSTFGANPGNLEMAAYSGKLYGTTISGGANNYGTIFEYDPTTNVYTKKFDFGPTLSSTGGSPKGSLLLYNNKFYGLATSYGANGAGVIFEWDPATNVFTKKYDLITANGGQPQNSLRLMNGKMYGTTSAGGAYSAGTVFEWDPATNVYTKLVDLDGSGATAIGREFYNNVTVYNNKLYCISHQGGLNGYGVLFVIDPSQPFGSNTTIIKQLDAASGGLVNNNEMIVLNNKLYGCMNGGGATTRGTLFELNPVGNIFTKLADFNYTPIGGNPLGKLVANGSKFLGLCNAGGVNGTGTVFEWDPASPSTIVKKYDLLPDNFDNVVRPSSAFTLAGSKFYAVSYDGGFVNQGNLFEYDYVSNTVTKKKTFNAAENGRIPLGKPVLLNGKLYGICYKGPQEIFGTAYGCLWSYDPSSSVYSRKILFNNVNNAANGRAPESAPIAYNGKLYGTTSFGGISDIGLLYEYDPLTESYTKKDMQPIAGSYPVGEPVVYNNKLYGMTNANGAGNAGIIYSYDPSTTVLSKLLDVQSIGSNKPSGAFTVFNSKLYGTTQGGGANNYGGVLMYDPVVNTASIVAAFSAAGGITVSNAPTLYNNKLYMLANNGGTNGRGSILQFDPATNTLTTIYHFNTNTGGNGYDPTGGLTANGSYLYAVVREFDNVRVIQLDPTTNTVTTRSTYTPTNNYNLPTTHNGLTVLPAFIANGIANSCETYPAININATNNNKWVPILNTDGDVVAEIKANGNNLGNVNANTYINKASVREDGQHRLYMDRNITVTVQNTTITGNVDLMLYIKKSEYDSLKNAVNSIGVPSGINSITDVAVFKNNETCDAAVNNPAVKLATIASNYEYGYVMAVSVSSFSTFYFANNNYATLPVSLVDFSAYKQSKAVVLHWQTINEINMASYEVEKSTDGRGFTILGSKTASNNNANNYNIIDVHPDKGYNYYRLKMINADGSFKYSGIKQIYFDGIISLSIWPNPAAESIVIPQAKANDQIRIVDAKGAVIMQGIIQQQNESIHINKLPAGIYMLQLISNKTIIQSRFVKQ